mmetsp:Transcript_10557/g.30640  ORF Transcript_10557/g.30640 Transcript_10557/m.30640 type:complete len:321 (+) Transcript_10557:1378-2340(+)
MPPKLPKTPKFLRDEFLRLPPKHLLLPVLPHPQRRLPLNPLLRNQRHPMHHPSNVHAVVLQKISPYKYNLLVHLPSKGLVEGLRRTDLRSWQPNKVNPQLKGSEVGLRRIPKLSLQPPPPLPRRRERSLALSRVRPIKQQLSKRRNHPRRRALRAKSLDWKNLPQNWSPSKLAVAGASSSGVPFMMRWKKASSISGQHERGTPRKSLFVKKLLIPSRQREAHCMGATTSRMPKLCPSVLRRLFTRLESNHRNRVRSLPHLKAHQRGALMPRACRRQRLQRPRWQQRHLNDHFRRLNKKRQLQKEHLLMPRCHFRLQCHPR